MIKISRTNINPPDGTGPNINGLEISYYDTNDKNRKEYIRYFACGQFWSRGDKLVYKIDDIFIKLNTGRNSEFKVLLKSLDTPQMITVGLTTLISFWTHLHTVLEKEQLSDTRFEVLD